MHVKGGEPGSQGPSARRRQEEPKLKGTGHKETCSGNYLLRPTSQLSGTRTVTSSLSPPISLCSLCL